MCVCVFICLFVCADELYLQSHMLGNHNVHISSVFFKISCHDLPRYTSFYGHVTEAIMVTIYSHFPSKRFTFLCYCYSQCYY